MGGVAHLFATLASPLTRALVLVVAVVGALGVRLSRFDLLVEFRFEDLGGRTRVHQTSVVEAKGALKVFFALFGRMMRKGGCAALQKELKNLKECLDSGAS